MIKGIIKRYSNILWNLFKGNYTMSVACAYLIPVHLALLGFLSKQVTLRDGIKVLLNSPATLHVNIFEEYGMREYSRCKEFVPRHGDIVFDIGAYVGIYTLRSAKRVGDDGLVYAFEPNPSAFTYLVSNVKINNVKNVKCFSTALSDHIGKNSFYTANDMHILASSLFESRLKKWAKNISKIKIKMDTLDNVVARQGISRIDVAKIDVEGAEERVLRGAKNTLSNGVIEKLIVEAHEDVNPINRTIELLTDFNYRIKYVLRHPGNNKFKSIIYAKIAR